MKNGSAPRLGLLLGSTLLLPFLAPQAWTTLARHADHVRSRQQPVEPSAFRGSTSYEARLAPPFVESSDLQR